MADRLVYLNETRENLLREYHITKDSGRAQVLARIIELEEEIAAEKIRRTFLSEREPV
ncbi:MAG: hypothetical protein GX973_06285 [Firmicutes bacterium]|nr:hypothetical protein [Bacillota bacterium]